MVQKNTDIDTKLVEFSHEQFLWKEKSQGGVCVTPSLLPCKIETNFRDLAQKTIQFQQWGE